MVVLCDSRGRHLQDYLPMESIKVLFYPGASLIDILQRSRVSCVDLDPKFILIHGGICNLSIKDRRSGKIQLVSSNEGELLDHMKSAFTSAWDLAHEMYPRQHVIFSGLCGMDINRYNGLEGYHDDQPLIDRVIESVNHHIVELNYRAGVYQAKMTSKIHKRSKTNGHRNQYRLLTDGIHPGPVVLRDWGKNVTVLYKLLLLKDESL